MCCCSRRCSIWSFCVAYKDVKEIKSVPGVFNRKPTFCERYLYWRNCCLCACLTLGFLLMCTMFSDNVQTITNWKSQLNFLPDELHDDFTYFVIARIVGDIVVDGFFVMALMLMISAAGARKQSDSYSKVRLAWMALVIGPFAPWVLIPFGAFVRTSLMQADICATTLSKMIQLAQFREAFRISAAQNGENELAAIAQWPPPSGSGMSDSFKSWPGHQWCTTYVSNWEEHIFSTAWVKSAISPSPDATPPATLDFTKTSSNGVVPTAVNAFVSGCGLAPDPYMSFCWSETKMQEADSSLSSDDLLQLSGGAHDSESANRTRSYIQHASANLMRKERKASPFSDQHHLAPDSVDDRVTFGSSSTARSNNNNNNDNDNNNDNNNNDNIGSGSGSRHNHRSSSSSSSSNKNHDPPLLLSPLELPYSLLSLGNLAFPAISATSLPSGGSVQGKAPSSPLPPILRKDWPYLSSGLFVELVQVRRQFADAWDEAKRSLDEYNLELERSQSLLDVASNSTDKANSPTLGTGGRCLTTACIFYKGCVFSVRLARFYSFACIRTVGAICMMMAYKNLFLAQFSIIDGVIVGCVNVKRVLPQSCTPGYLISFAIIASMPLIWFNFALMTQQSGDVLFAGAVCCFCTWRVIDLRRADVMKSTKRIKRTMKEFDRWTSFQFLAQIFMVIFLIAYVARCYYLYKQGNIIGTGFPFNDLSFSLDFASLFQINGLVGVILKFMFTKLITKLCSTDLLIQGIFDACDDKFKVGNEKHTDIIDEWRKIMGMADFKPQETKEEEAKEAERKKRKKEKKEKREKERKEKEEQRKKEKEKETEKDGKEDKDKDGKKSKEKEGKDEKKIASKKGGVGGIWSFLGGDESEQSSGSSSSSEEEEEPAKDEGVLRRDPKTQALYSLSEYSEKWEETLDAEEILALWNDYLEPLPEEELAAARAARSAAAAAKEASAAEGAGKGGGGGAAATATAATTTGKGGGQKGGGGKGSSAAAASSSSSSGDGGAVGGDAGPSAAAAAAPAAATLQGAATAASSSSTPLLGADEGTASGPKKRAF